MGCDLRLLHRLTLANVFKLCRLRLRLPGGRICRIGRGSSGRCSLLLRHLLLERGKLGPHLVQLLLRLLELCLRAFHGVGQLLDLCRNGRLCSLRREPERGGPKQHGENRDRLPENMGLFKEVCIAITTKRFHGR